MFLDPDLLETRKFWHSTINEVIVHILFYCACAKYDVTIVFLDPDFPKNAKISATCEQLSRYRITEYLHGFSGPRSLSGGFVRKIREGMCNIVVQSRCPVVRPTQKSVEKW